MHVWRERLQRWFTPVARSFPLSPNAITVIALILNAGAAGLFYAGGRRPLFYVAGVVVVIVGGLADAFDGIVARVQGKQSRYGDFLDHFCDRVGDVLLIAGWLGGNGVRPSLAAGAIIAVMLNGYVGTQIEATWHERRYDAVGRAEFVLALIVFPLVSYILASNGWQGTAPGGLRIPEWLTAAITLSAVLGIVQRMRMAAAMER